MLPPSLKGNYKQYKTDTDIVAQWLVVTAKENGYKKATTARKAPAVGPGGEARKLGRVGTADLLSTMPGAVVDDESSTHKPRYIIGADKFEPLAKFVSKLPNLKVPDYFTAAIERAINGKIAQKLAIMSFDAMTWKH